MTRAICQWLVLLTGLWVSAAGEARPQAETEPEAAPEAAAEGIAARHPHDRNIGRDRHVLFASGFERGFDGFTHFRNEAACSVVKDRELAHGGRACAQVTATRRKDEGGGIGYRWQPGPDRIHLRFYCRFHEDTVRPHHFVSLTAAAPGYDPGGRAGLRRQGDDSFHSVIEPPGLEKDLGWHFYTYWHEMRSWQREDGLPENPPNGTGTSFYGNTFCPDGQDDEFVRGRWICVEIMMKENTPGEHDGEQAFWIDGRKLGHWRQGSPVGTWHRSTFWTKQIKWNSDPQPFAGMNWRTDEKVKLDRILLGWYVSHETARKATTDENVVYFDDVVVATEYIGPRT